MTLIETCTVELEHGEVEFQIEIDKEDGEWELIYNSITMFNKPYSPSNQEMNIMQEEAEEIARNAFEQYQEERLESWED